MRHNVTLCNNCAGTIILSLNEHVTEKGLRFCCIECADHFFSPDNDDRSTPGLAYDLGCEGAD